MARIGRERGQRAGGVEPERRVLGIVVIVKQVVQGARMLRVRLQTPSEDLGDPRLHVAARQPVTCPSCVSSYPIRLRDIVPSSARA